MGCVPPAVIWCQGIAERVNSAGSLMAHVLLVRGHHNPHKVRDRPEPQAHWPLGRRRQEATEAVGTHCVALEQGVPSRANVEV